MKRIEAKPDTPSAPCVWSVRLFILPGKEEPVKLVTEILGGPQAETVREVFDWMCYNGSEASALPLAAGD